MTTSSRRRAPLKLAAGLVAISFVLGACSDSKKSDDAGNGPPTSTGSETAGPATPESVAMKLSDLPDGFQQCSFTGEINAYIEHFNQVNPQMAQGLRTNWQNLQSKGATEGYYASFGDRASACASMQGGSADHEPDQHDPANSRAHLAEAFTFVVAYRDQAAAEKVFQDDTFGQSSLGGQGIDVVEGEATGLGPNSAMSSSRDANVPVRQAVWQNKAFTVLLGTENLQPPESQSAINAINGRIG